MDKKEIKNTDTFTLGGKEFTSRFILGSGKFSLDLVKACVEKREHRLLHWHSVVQMKAVWQIFWIIFRKM